jgi:hypothetical protein
MGRDLGGIQVRVVAASRADDLKQAGVTAFEAAVHYAGRLAPHERRPAVAGLTGERERHGVVGLDAQPRVTVIVRARCEDGRRTDSGSGTSNGVRVAHLLTARR